MNKTIKKLISLTLTILLIFNFYYGNCFPVYAEDGLQLGDGITWIVNTLTNLLGGLIGFHTYIPRLLMIGIGFAVNVLTAQIAYMDGTTATGDDGILSRFVLTPFEIFFNEIQILDVNFLDISVGGTTEIIRTSVAKWYYIMRLISVAILLLILIYVGIRMALASVASEKAIYKKALVDWVTSLALVFLLQYIVMFTVNANSAIVAAMKSTVTSNNVDDKILGIAMMSLGISFESIAATGVYVVFVIQVLIFLFKYIKRMITVAFLIIISPLISITYSIDKMGDGKAQALNNWLKEFVFNVLIQPFHCIIYMAFIDTAFTLLTGGGGVIKGIFSMIPGLTGTSDLANGILAILCMMFVDDAEKIVKKIFGFDAASSLSSSLTTMAAMGTALNLGKKAPEMAQNLRKGMNVLKSDMGKVGKVANSIGAKAERGVAAFKERDTIKESIKGKKGQERKTAKEQAKDKAVEKYRGDKAKKLKDKAEKRRESKIAREMKKFGGYAFKEGEESEEQYEARRKKAVDSLKNKEDKAIERKENISKVAGKVGNKIENARGYVRKKMPDAVGGFVFVAGALSGNPLIATEGFKAARSGTEEFLKTSKRSLVEDVRKNANESYTEQDFKSIYQKHLNGDLGNGTDELKDLLLKLEAILGDAKQAKAMFNNIQLDMARSNEDSTKKYDLDKILDQTAAATGVDKSAFMDVAKQLEQYQRDTFLGQALENAGKLGYGVEDMHDAAIGRDANYGTETIVQVSNSTETTNVSKEETTIEQIGRIDNIGQLETMLREIEEKLNTATEQQRNQLEQEKKLLEHRINQIRTPNGNEGE